MADIWQLLLVFTAIAIGWWLGRRGRLVSADEGALHHQYYKGLNFLINDQPDGALDAFIEALEVNSETLETHIAVGNLMRRKGEVERAIRIHQNLLARPSLPRVHLHQAHLELARDFISAGLLDRAERLLHDLIKEAPELKETAMRHLLEIYKDEKEWQQAIDVAEQLLPKRSLLKAAAPVDKTITAALSHYCCELAELSLVKNDYHSARAQLKKALSHDRNCVRASLLIADIEFRTGHYAKAIKSLRKVRDQDPVFIPETIELLRSSFEHLGDDEGFYRYMMESLDIYPSASVLLHLVDDITAKKGVVAAAGFLGQELKKRPSLRGLAKLVEFHIANSSGQSKESLGILQLLIEQLMQSKPQYQCHHCGFSGKRLHWMCPGCKQWGQVKAIRGAEGD
ncbi:lipopolysaccharide assembly protein LapB [Oceanicoccus sagamiensis]|uniref:Lipopolysaccharide assembly protein B n=1 Tax=Oceanicoccus sagamiensis TaxID=716816 RepID=A0A1X9N598_9GAMM|nr:lipopolysaccharide assembly protein LapB [Oceanicoccus sagamiensis]ARN72906.1 lipopolysaccharide assembly protein LapB [Oceanicoccus sagamiensis]